MLWEDGIPGRDEVLAHSKERCHRFVAIANPGFQKMKTALIPRASMTGC
jgi:hypothetical protein